MKTVDCAAQTHRQLPPLLCLCWWSSFGTRNSTEAAERNRRPAGNTGLIWCNAETGSQSCNRKERSHTTTDTPQGIKIRHFLWAEHLNVCPATLIVSLSLTVRQNSVRSSHHSQISTFRVRLRWCLSDDFCWEEVAYKTDLTMYSSTYCNVGFSEYSVELCNHAVTKTIWNHLLEKIFLILVCCSVQESAELWTRFVFQKVVVKQKFVAVCGKTSPLLCCAT